MTYLQRFFGHLKTILIHKYWVLYYCFHAGLFWQGLLHDLSKFSPIEFIEGVKWYLDGTESPIDRCRRSDYYSKAWLHHKGRNKHHYQYWYNGFARDEEPIMMPYKYAAEMLCDMLGAARTYMKGDFSFAKEVEWWEEKNKVDIPMHTQTWLFIDTVIRKLGKAQLGTEVLILDKDNLKREYYKTLDLYFSLKGDDDDNKDAG